MLWGPLGTQLLELLRWLARLVCYAVLWPGLPCLAPAPGSTDKTTWPRGVEPYGGPGSLKLPVQIRFRFVDPLPLRKFRSIAACAAAQDTSFCRKFERLMIFGFHLRRARGVHTLLLWAQGCPRVLPGSSQGAPRILPGFSQASCNTPGWASLRRGSIALR
jgi:hypothetical protein